jgi:hypothetical protein
MAALPGEKIQLIPLKWPEEGSILTISFRAEPVSVDKSLQVMIGIRDSVGSARELFGWKFDKGKWQFDARGVSGMEKFVRKLPESIARKPVSGTIVLDRVSYQAYGELVDSDGRRHPASPFNLFTSTIYGRPVNWPNAEGVIIAQPILQGDENRPPINNIEVSYKTWSDESIAPLPRHDDLPKAVIEYSWTSADTVYVRENFEKMEEVPLSGICLRVADPRFPNGTVLNGVGKGDAGWAVFQNRLIDQFVFDAAIDDLTNTEFRSFRNNYVVVVSFLRGDIRTIDWFDDSWWKTICHNANQIAGVAKAGGARGILLDLEEYGCNLYTFSDLAAKEAYAGQDYEQTEQKVRQRGREFMRALNASYPGIDVLLLHGWERLIMVTAGERDRLPHVGWGLMVSFLDGLLEGADTETRIIDGLEAGYYIESADDFARQAERLRRYGPKISAVPDLFRKKVRVGCAIYLDGTRRWHPHDIDRNKWSPEDLEQLIRRAMAVTDGLVWVYSERATWWLDSPDAKLGGGIDLGTGVGDYDSRNQEIKWIPPSYRTAVRRALDAVGGSPIEH